MVRVSITTSWVVNFALFRCYRPVIYTRPRFYPVVANYSSHKHISGGFRGGPSRLRPPFGRWTDAVTVLLISEQ